LILSQLAFLKIDVLKFFGYCLSSCFVGECDFAKVIWGDIEVLLELYQEIQTLSKAN